MLPSSGYFKNIVCPYFKSGFCERSHCHFSHAKAASSSGRPLFGRSLPDSNKDFLDVFDRANLLHSTGIEQTLENNCGTSYEEEPADFDYVPTPVDSYVPKVSSILKKSKGVKYPLSTVPEYRPTPISRLKQPGAPDSSDENSRESLSSSALSKKRKKVEEYDPTEVKCAFKKRVSFNLPADDDKDDSQVKRVSPCIVLDSSDDDDGINPQFSDDEFEEDNVSDEAGSPVMEKTDIMDFNTDMVRDTVLADTSESILHTPPSSEISGYSLVDKILTEVKKNETMEDVHKQSLKATSTHTSADMKDHKPYKSEIKDSQKNSKEISDKPKKTVLKSKELSTDSVSQLRFKDEKLHKDSTNSQANKKDNLCKRATSDKPKTKELSLESNKPSDKMLLDKKHHKAQNQNKVIKTHSTSNKISSHSEEQNKSEKLKIKSEHKDIDKKDRSITKHDLLKSKSSTKVSEKDSKNIVNSKKSNKDVEKVKKKENVKIQDEKVSSSCHASHKKTVSSEKRHSSSPPKKKIKPNNDVKPVVKTKSSPTVHKLSRRPELPESDLKRNSDKEIQVNVQESAEQINRVKSSPHHETSDSDEDVHFPMCDSDMDSDTYEECLRIFNEHEQSREQTEKLYQVKEEKQEDMFTVGPKRVAHEKAVPKPKVPKQEPLPHPSQVMHNRYLQLQGMYARQNSSEEKRVPSAFVNSTAKGIETIKKRITVAPNADLVAAVTQKQKLLQSSRGSSSNKLPEEITYVETVTKRVAHVPSQVTKPRPIIPVEYGCKVPSNVRQRYLNNFIDECLKFCSDEEEAYQTALEEEKRAYERSSNKTVYLNVAINALKRLRNQAMESQSQAAGAPTSSFRKSSPEQSVGGTDAKMKNKTISHEMMLGGARAQRTSFSIEKKKPKVQDTEIKGKKLYDALMTYVLTTEQLVENGYPLPHPAEPGRALVSGMYVTKRPSSNDPFKKVCSRCQKPYQIDDSGDYVKTEECEYHWGHLWQKRIGRSMERQYSCCGGDSQSDGCCLAAGHVFDGDESDMLKGYVKTLPKTPPPDGYYGVYALDCEMCYTAGGIELIRVTVINPDMKPVYESFVKPDNKILDYNTRFSGITEEQLKGVETSLRDVQAILLCLFNSKTILIGHSLESDFKALKLIHTTVVDTSVVFPHKRGLPYKRALRTLMAEYMRKIIQNSLEGHDSNEDAVACMELMLWKIKEDMKRSR